MIPLPIIRSPAARELLARFGWSPERAIDLSTVLTDWQSAYITDFPVATRALTSLCGIELDFEDQESPFPGLECVSFGPDSTQQQHMQYLELTHHLRLFAIGCVDWVTIYLDVDGRVYSEFGPVCLIGDDLDDALMGLMAGRKWVRIREPS